MPRRARAEAGFTLIEVLIGIALLAMLGVLIADGIRLGGRAWNNAERQTGNSDEMVLLQSLFRRTILRAAPAFGSADPRDMTIAFAGDADTLTLTAPQPGTLFDGPWVRERFYLGPNGASRALFVAWQRDGAPPTGPVLLLDHVRAIRFAYFGPGGAGGAPDWQDSWQNRSRLPDLVRVAIARDDARLRAWPELVVATRMTANAGCVFDLYRNTCQRVP
jgi:general secretion pathway protein J